MAEQAVVQDNDFTTIIHLEERQSIIDKASPTSGNISSSWSIIREEEKDKTTSKILDGDQVKNEDPKHPIENIGSNEDNQVLQQEPSKELSMRSLVQSSEVFPLNVLNRSDIKNKIPSLLDRINSLNQEKECEDQAKQLISVYSEIGNEYIRNYQYKDASEYLQKALDLYDKHKKKLDVEMDNIFELLALAYYKKNKFEQSLTVVNQHWAPYIQNKGKDLPPEIHLQVGKTLRKLARPKEALEEYFEAYELLKKQFGDQHPDIASILFEMGKIYRNIGDFAKSEDSLRKALEIFKQHTEDTHYIRAIIYQELSNLSVEQGKYQEAQSKLVKALGIYVMKYGEINIYTAKCYCSIANLCFRLGKYEDAHKEYKKVMSIVNQMEDKDFLLIANVKKGLGDVYCSQGNHEKALSKYEASLNIKKKIFKRNHPEIANILCVIGGVLCRLGQYKMSKERLDNAKNIYLEYFGKENQSMITLYSQYANLYSKQGQDSDALESFKKCLELGVKFYGETYPELAPVYLSIGDLSRKFEKYEEAKLSYTKALETKKRYSKDEKEISRIKEKIKCVEELLGIQNNK